AAGRHRGRPPRLLHVEPRPPGRGRHRDPADGGPARRGDSRRRALPQPRDPLARARSSRAAGRLLGRQRGASRGHAARARGVPGHAGPRHGVRRGGLPRRTGARRRRLGPARRPGSLRRAAGDLRRGPLPLPGGHVAARGAGGDRLVRGRCGDGRPAPVPAPRGRAVPPRVDPVLPRVRHDLELLVV
ncbi:MAG: Anthranilate synthase, amidotransferase component @ Para-aminobenzoate synthase, amidotransferase component, partial [uncultured Nocardioides sp.]